MAEPCPNCGTLLIGEYCHGCGQRHITGRLVVRDLLDEVLRRILRFDKSFLHTIGRMLRGPGTLVADYLEGRRHLLLDPIPYFISSVFVQVVIAAFTRTIAPLIYRDSALGWLTQIGGVVAAKILIIFWMASIWYVLFRPVRYNLAEMYVFAIYVFATTGLLWSAVPLVDLVVPAPLGDSPAVVSGVTLGIEYVYTSYAVMQFTGLSVLQSGLRVATVLGVGYGGVVAWVGLERAAGVLLPPMPGA